MATDRRRIGSMFLPILLNLLLFRAATAEIVELGEDNWHQMLENEWMVEFFAPWCPACKALQPIWKEFSSWSDDLEISVGQVDVTNSPGLSGRFMVTALPTIYHVKDGVFRQYRGSRDKDEFMSFIEEKKWKELEEIPAWKSPSSFQMSIVSQFFKLSMVLRSVHSILIEDYGLPTWGSYLVFALATILVGALLGLLLVCIIDFVFPPKTCGAYHPSSPDDKEADDDEDITEDVDGSQETTPEGVDESQEEDESQDEGQNAAGSQDESQCEDDDEEEEEEEEKEEAEKCEETTTSSSPSVRKRRARKD